MPIQVCALRCIQPSAIASQYTFIVTTKPATRASQLKSETTLGATKSSATVKMTLTSSQTNRPTKAAPACGCRICRAKALTKTTPGTTTDTTPQATDAASRNWPLTKPVSAAATAPTNNCKTRTRQGEVKGLRCRQAVACSGVRGLKSGSRPSSAESACPHEVFALGGCAAPWPESSTIVLISNYTEVTQRSSAKPTIIRRNPCQASFFRLSLQAQGQKRPGQHPSKPI
jgi:hypothetical protein